MFLCRCETASTYWLMFIGRPSQGATPCWWLRLHIPGRSRIWGHQQGSSKRGAVISLSLAVMSTSLPTFEEPVAPAAHLASSTGRNAATCTILSSGQHNSPGPMAMSAWSASAISHVRKWKPLSNAPHLKAIMPVAGTFDLYESATHHGLMSSGFVTPFLAMIGMTSGHTNKLWRSKLVGALRALLLTPGIHKKFETANGEAAIAGSRASSYC